MISIRNIFSKIFDLKAEESHKFMLLFFHSFFLGITISFHFVPANSVFIKHFGSHQLPYAYLASGALGYVITQIYSILQKRTSPDGLFKSALFFLWVLLIVQVVGQYFFDEKWLSFFVFISAAPLFTLIALETGGLAMKLLNLRQMKRLFGLINIGGIVAAILSYLLLIPIIITYIGNPFNLIYFAIGGVTISFFFLLKISKTFDEDHTKQKEGVAEKEAMSWKELFKEKYFSLIFTVAAISTVVIYFNDFFYLASIKAQENLLDNPGKVSMFIAIVSAVFKIGELLGSYFANRFLSRYGMKLGLTLLPYVSTTLILLASPFGLIFGSGSIIFFVLIVSNKILDRTLRMSVGEISFNILYQPLPNKQKLAIQTRVGVVIQIASGTVGLLLLALTSLLTTDEGFELKYFSLFYLPMLLAWLFLSRRLFIAYRTKLKQILTDISRNTKRDIYKLNYGLEILTKKFKQFNEKVVNLSVTIVSETNPKMLERYASSLLKSSDEVVARAILRNIDPTWRSRLSSSIQRFKKKNQDPELNQLAERAIFRLTNAIDAETSVEQLSAWIESGIESEQIKAIQYIQGNKFKDRDSYIIQLLKSEHKTVKNGAISLAALCKTPALIDELIMLLKNEKYHHISADILLQIGDLAIDKLKELFSEKGIPPQLLVQTVEILAKIGTNSAKQVMVKNMNYTNRDVQMAIIRGLYFCRYQASHSEVDAVRRKLEETIENILWIYSTILDLENEKNTLKIYQAIDQEREKNLDILFKILSFLYEPRIINLIRKNIIGQNTIFALEIIDNFIDQDIKQLIIPIFDEISISQKIKKFSNQFPQQKLSLTDRLREMVIRDYNKLDIWTISKAIELLGKLHKKKQSKAIKAVQQGEAEGVEVWTTKKVNKLLIQIRRSEMPDEVVAALYHPEELVFNMAARTLYDENPSRCFDYLRKLPDRYLDLKTLLEGTKIDQMKFLGERIRLLKRHPYFFSVPENSLVKLAKLFKIHNVKSGETLQLIDKENQNEYIFIVVKGELKYISENEQETVFGKNSFVTSGLNLQEQAQELFVSKDSLVLYADKHKYFNILVTNTELIKHIFDRIQSKTQDSEEEHED